MSQGRSEAFEQRARRVRDAIALREPDRVPFSTIWHFWPARYAGMSCREAMYEHARYDAAVRKAVLDLKPDAYSLMQPGVGLGPTFEQLGFRMLAWPGHGVDPDSTYQYLDREYMRADEYDEFLFDPTGFALRKYLPRVAEAFEGFEGLPDLPAAPYLGLAQAMPAFAAPEVAASFERLAAAGRAMIAMLGGAIRLAGELAELGFPMAFGTLAPAPYDYLADYMRGSRGAMLDMFRQPEKLLAGIEKARAILAPSTIARASALPSQTVFVPLHWGLDGFMSAEQFERFYWPSLRDFLIALIEADLTPLVLWEGNCESRLELIGEIPAGKAVYHFERTDPVKARRALGERVCLRGFVPVSLLTTGTPAEVEEYCRRLIGECAAGGGLIVDGAVGIPDDARIENVFALRDAVWRHGASG